MRRRLYTSLPGSPFLCRLRVYRLGQLRIPALQRPSICCRNADSCSATADQGKVRWKRYLLLEQIFKSLAGVIRARRRHGYRACGSRLRVGGWGCIFFHGHAKFIKFTAVLRVFRGEALRDRLRTFKLRSGIKKPALLATVQLKLALGTCSVGIESRRKHGAAIGTTRSGHRSYHARGPRSELIGSARPARRWPLVV